MIIYCSFGAFCPVWGSCPKKHLATLLESEDTKFEKLKVDCAALSKIPRKKTKVDCDVVSKLTFFYPDLA
jgi:hypothetical protein